MTHLSRHVVETSDGSKTLFIPEMDEHYHSIHGAIQESRHIFLNTGLNLFLEKEKLRILELGFGTGLNAILSLEWANIHKKNIDFVSLEKYPLQKDEYEALGYGSLLKPELQSEFLAMHDCPWEDVTQISSSFSLLKSETDIKAFRSEPIFDGIFFDAFSPDNQSDLWTLEVFENYFGVLNQGGFLVTYCAKGQVRRNMIAAGFQVERLAGPPGKREMLRAIKM